MSIDRRLAAILDAARDGNGPGREACAYLLGFPEVSPETALLCATADSLSRRRFSNQAILLGQIGVEIAPCPGKCQFCSFGEAHTEFGTLVLPPEEIQRQARAFANAGDLFALFLMTMHVFDFDRLLETVALAKAAIPPSTRIVVNIGDFDQGQAETLRAAGVSGAYHVLRLREGTDTALSPDARKATVRAIRSAGLDWYYCCEPVGPEHTAEEVVEQLFFGVENGCFQHAAMRRVVLPHSPLRARGQITERRLAQVTAVVALASLACRETANIAVHEPNLLGLAAGANVVYAEAGANPRDTEAETTGHRGADLPACRKMLWEAGFTALLRGDGQAMPLDFESLET